MTEYLYRTDSAGAAAPWLARMDRASFELAPPEVTPEGFLLCEAHFAKPGILEYIREDGSVRRELILPEDLFNADSLATMARKPVTNEHPDGKVNSANVGELGVGDTDSEVLAIDNTYAKVRICVRRADAVRCVRNGKLQVSPGYEVLLDETPGTHPVYGRYDARQLRRRYNHLALTDVARGGPDIRLRADGGMAVVNKDSSGWTMHPKLIALFLTLGVKVRKDSEEVMLDEATAKASDMCSKADELTARATELGEAKARIAAMETELAALKAKIVEPAEAGAVVEEAMDADPPADTAAATVEQKNADSIRRAARQKIKERGILEQHARALGVLNMDKMGNKALRKAVVEAADPSVRGDSKRSDEYYRARVDMMALPQRSDSAGTADPYTGIRTALANNLDAASAGQGERADAAKPPPNADRAWAENVNKSFNERHNTANR